MGLRARRRNVVVWNSSAGLATAALGLHAPRTLLVVLAHPRDLDPWCEDLLSFSGLRPTVFPAWDSWPAGERVIDRALLRLYQMRGKLAEAPVAK